MKLATKISNARKRKNYTQAELGNKLHVSRKTISSWENGRSTPNNEMIRALEAVLDIKIINDQSQTISKNEAEKQINHRFNSAVLIFNIISTVMAVIDTAIPIFAFWIMMLQLLVDMIIFYNFHKQLRKMISQDKLLVTLVLIISVILLTLTEIEQTIRDTVFMVNLSAVFFMMIRSFIIAWGILFVLFFQKLFKHND